MPRRRRKIEFHFLTLFPEVIEPYVSASLFKRARETGTLKIKTHNLRDYTRDPRNVDDKPFGGGAGMVLKVEPIYRAVRRIKQTVKRRKHRKRTRVILFSTRGKTFTGREARRLSRYDNLVFICGRYEGVDERVAEHVADEEISIGDYVLSGGELPALVVAEAVSRFVPGFLGKRESLEEVKGSYPVYTRPAEFTPPDKKRPWRVPKVLRSGDHKKIDAWRKRG